MISYMISGDIRGTKVPDEPLLDNALVVNSEKSLDALLNARFVM